MVKNRKNKIVIVFPTKKHSVNGWLAETEMFIGQGGYGAVFKVCKDKNCNYAMKVIRNYNIDEVKREICIQNICAEYNLCKPVIDWWLVQNGGVIISPVMEETIYQKLNRINNTLYLKSQTYGEKKIATIIKNVWKLVFKLHELGIYHGDCHQGNIMTDGNDNMYFIDMGSSGFTLELPGGKNTEKYKDAVIG
jgi:tRNA A-37 threonylcarbamoyl transferase component Bud32